MVAKIELNINTDNNTELLLLGRWDKESLKDVTNYKDKIETTGDGVYTLNLQKIERLDSAGAVLVLEIVDFLDKNQKRWEIINLKDENKKLIELCKGSHISETENTRDSINLFEKVGKFSVEMFSSWLSFLVFLGEAFSFVFYVLLHPIKFRFTTFIRQIHHSGIKALPIVGLTTFLVGLIIAYQASFQLEKFGASIFIVEMSAISLFRELSPMIAAIVIAGRSASAFAAEIGTMKITQEIDAMKTMGFPPQLFLVLPRLFALMIAMPLIVFFADMMGIIGAIIVADINLGISYVDFINRMGSEINIKHLLIGVIKAPIFGILIALIGCFYGFRAGGSTDSIGIFTTKSVVSAIFWVIACDAIISVVLTEIGI